jgi:hypothetical protein
MGRIRNADLVIFRNRRGLLARILLGNPGWSASDQPSAFGLASRSVNAGRSRFELLASINAPPKGCVANRRKPSSEHQARLMVSPCEWPV